MKSSLFKSIFITLINHALHTATTICIVNTKNMEQGMGESEGGSRKVLLLSIL